MALPANNQNRNFIELINRTKAVKVRGIVSFLENNEEKVKILNLDGFVTLPDEACNILVNFQAMRIPWYNIKKWNRKEKIWAEPIRPEVFYYDKPPKRRFILEGALWNEKITTVYDEMNTVIEYPHF